MGAPHAVVSPAGSPPPPQEAVSQSATTMAQYKSLRDDYRRLLTARVEAVRRAGVGAGKEAKAVVSELQSRLVRPAPFYPFYPHSVAPVSQSNRVTGARDRGARGRGSYL